jgi:hypothetical protein
MSKELQETREREGWLVARRQAREVRSRGPPLRPGDFREMRGAIP